MVGGYVSNAVICTSSAALTNSTSRWSRWRAKAGRRFTSPRYWQCEAAPDVGLRQAAGDEPDYLIDLGLGEGRVTKRDVVALQDQADGAAVDTEGRTQLVHGLASSVAVDQLRGLLRVQAACPPDRLGR